MNILWQAKPGWEKTQSALILSQRFVMLLEKNMVWSTFISDQKGLDWLVKCLQSVFGSDYQVSMWRSHFDEALSRRCVIFIPNKLKTRRESRFANPKFDVTMENSSVTELWAYEIQNFIIMLCGNPVIQNMHYLKRGVAFG